MADGLATDLPGRARLRDEVGHGLDARHARLHGARAGSPEVPPRRADLPHGVRYQRELRPAPVTRRGRLREGVAARQDAGGRVAEAGEPAPAPRLHVYAARQEAPLHGRRVRAVERVEPRREPRLAPPRGAGAPDASPLGARPEHGLPRRAVAPRAGRRSRGLRLGGLQRRRAERTRLSAPRPLAAGDGSPRGASGAGGEAWWKGPGRNSGGGGVGSPRRQVSPGGAVPGANARRDGRRAMAARGRVSFMGCLLRRRTPDVALLL